MGSGIILRIDVPRNEAECDVAGTVPFMPTLKSSQRVGADHRRDVSRRALLFFQ